MIAQHVLVIKWSDKKKYITMISTYHGDETQTFKKRKQKVKLVCILDYNQYMGGVDLKDQLLESYLVERKRTNKWYMNVTMISTFHDNTLRTLCKRGVEVKKPVCVLEYNQQLGGVDLKDQKLQPYLLERKRGQCGT
jgi:hypothetical protein